MQLIRIRVDVGAGGIVISFNSAYEAVSLRITANNTIKLENNVPKRQYGKFRGPISSTVLSFKRLRTTASKSNMGPFKRLYINTERCL